MIGILAVAGVITYLQLGVTTAQLMAISKSERMSRADVIIVARPNETNASGIPRGLTPAALELLGQSGVVAAIEPVYVRSLRVPRLPGDPLDLRIVDPDPPALSLPRTLDNSVAAVLRTPFNVVLTEADSRRLSLDLGETIEFRSQTLIVAGIVRGGLGRGQSMISKQTFKAFNPARPISDLIRPVSVLVQLTDRTQLRNSAQQLDAMLAPLGASAMTQEDLVRQITERVLSTRDDLRGFLIVAVIVAFLAVTIVLQATSSAIAAQHTEFGILLAIGVPYNRLSAIVIEQVAWAGILGAAYALVGALVASLALRWLDVEFVLQQDYVFVVSALVFSASVLGGLAALPAVFAIKPLDLLR